MSACPTCLHVFPVFACPEGAHERAAKTAQSEGAAPGGGGAAGVGSYMARPPTLPPPQSGRANQVLWDRCCQVAGVHGHLKERCSRISNRLTYLF
jgi:hypothetical protein